MAVARVLGIVGWSGSGKTTLLTRLIPILVGQGMKVSTIKRAHHEFDVDRPGKDSYEHRRAGASEVIVSSSGRWAQMHELRDEPELTLAQLLRRLSPCDLILVEGFKREMHPKLEVYRSVVGEAPLYPQDGRIVAVATDQPAEASVPMVDLNDADAVARLVISEAQPLDAVLAVLETSGCPDQRAT
jgi:molybdopterin-guanine dinucleotide biosynthesis adapter protein